MYYRPLVADPADSRLGRLLPDDWRHLEHYPLTADTQPIKPTPVVIGVNWYDAFDRPVKASDGYWVARGGGDLGRIRGGHAVCLEPGGYPDRWEWQIFYDQKVEGSCVGASWSRCMTLLNRRRYAFRWLWDRAKERDQWTEQNPGDGNGTSVRAAAEILLHNGHVPWKRTHSPGDDSHITRNGYTPQHSEGIAAFRWAKSVDDVHTVLRNPRADKLGAVPILNSWGSSYPKRVWLPDDVLDRLLFREDGEAATITDR